ncbi:MAG TPA: 23S rRNA (guanosine(2251)-2'-O)-methyltransferase RlmB [Ruminiclostridium sp.]|nr:23S rRNA (guanosine(2251)-2'-O)-methyltransferase RlmB [Ruminiclostridium sp.]
MRKNNNDTRRGPRTPSDGRTRGAGTGKGSGSPRPKSGFKARREDSESYSGRPGRAAGDYRGRKSGGYESGGYGEKRRSADWREDDYRRPKKEPGKGPAKKFREYEEQGAGGFRNTRKSAEPKTAYRDSKRGFEKRPRTFTDKKADNQRPKIDAYKKQETFADNHEAEDEAKDYRIQGRNPVFEALRSGRPLNKLFVEKDKDDTMISRIVAMAREKDIPIQYFDKNKLDALSQSRIHQGVILEVAAKKYVEVEDILDQAEEKGEKSFVLVLDEITDTNNLGSMIRSAECAGVHGIIIPKRRSATLNTTVAKVAAGAMEYVPVARVSNLVQTLRQLKEKGLWIIGADMEGQNNYYDADLTGPCALVIGNEGEGLGRLVKDECDLMVRIPMKGRISSLNAGVAAALVMFEIAKQRG